MDSTIQSIDASSLVSVLWLDGLNSVAFDGLISSEVFGCKRVITVQNTAPQDDTDAVQVRNAQFFDISAGALNFTNNSAAVYDSGFKNVTRTPSTVTFDTDDGSAVTISNCTFADLTVRDPDYFDGAALHLSSPNITITDSTFTNCTARKGGALYTYTNETLSPNWPSSDAYVAVSACHFDSSFAGFGGGGVYLSGDDGTTRIHASFLDTTFSGNAAIFGGALAGIAVSDVYVSTCTFEHNMAYQGLGAGLHFDGTAATYTNTFLFNSTFANNVIPQINGYDQATDEVSQYEQCAGAFLRFGQCAGVLNCTFTSNVGTGLCVNDYSSVCEFGQFQANLEAAFGGSRNALGLFDRSTISSPGGQAFFDEFLGKLSCSLDVRNSVFENNIVPYLVRRFHRKTTLWSVGDVTGGGGIYIEGVQRSVFAGLIFKNNSAFQGSAMYLSACYSIVIWNSTCDNNSALDSGGAIAVVNSHGSGMMLGNSTICNGKARTGAAVYGESRSSIVVTNGTLLVNNTATSQGGAVHCINCKEVTAQLGSMLASNQASEAGACHCDNCEVFQLQDSVIENNQ